MPTLPKVTLDCIYVPFLLRGPETDWLLGHLSTNPLRTKAATSGLLSALQEFLASYIAGEKSPSGSYVTSRVPKMAIYGVTSSCSLVLINRLLSLLLWVTVWASLCLFLTCVLVLTMILQRAFQGKTTVKDKILQILFSNLFVSPALSYLTLSTDCTNSKLW